MTNTGWDTHTSRFTFVEYEVLHERAYELGGETHKDEVPLHWIELFRRLDIAVEDGEFVVTAEEAEQLVLTYHAGRVAALLRG